MNQPLQTTNKLLPSRRTVPLNEKYEEIKDQRSLSLLLLLPPHDLQLGHHSLLEVFRETIVWGRGVVVREAVPLENWE